MPMAKAGRTMWTERPRLVRAAALLPLAAALAGCAGLGGASSPPPAARPAAPKLGPQKAAAIANAYTAGYNGLRRKFWDESTEGFQRAVSFNPTDDGAAYLAALSYTRARNLPATLEWLHELWRLNSCSRRSRRRSARSSTTPRSTTSSSSSGRRSRRRTARPPCSRSARGISSRATSRGIPPAKVFYLASLRKRRIVRVTPGAPGEKASLSDFSRAGDLDAVLGVKVDAARRRLWAVTAADPAMEGFRPGDFGRSQLVAFDLATGALAGRWSPMTRPPHQFGGLALDDAGSVWVTDTASGEVHVLKPGAEELLPVAPKGTFVAPKSIAVSADGTRVYVADLARGVYRLNPRTGVADVLDQPPGTVAGGPGRPGPPSERPRRRRGHRERRARGPLDARERRGLLLGDRDPRLRPPGLPGPGGRHARGRRLRLRREQPGRRRGARAARCRPRRRSRTSSSCGCLSGVDAPNGTSSRFSS